MSSSSSNVVEVRDVNGTELGKVPVGVTKADVLEKLGYSLKTEGLMLVDHDGLALLGTDIVSVEKGPYVFKNVLSPKLPQQFLAETAAAVEELVNNYLAKKKTIVVSHATSTAENDVLDMLELAQQGVSWPVKPEAVTIPNFPIFQWLPGDEKSEANRTAYMAHLRTNLRLPSNFSMADVQAHQTSFSVNLPGKEKRRKIIGTSGIVISEEQNVQNKALRHNVECLLEVKTPENIKLKNHNPKIVCEHMAVSYLNQHHAVVSVLTDLNLSWTFYWFGRSRTDYGGRVVLYKLMLPDDEEQSAGLAKYILDNLFDKSLAHTLPETFVERLSFASVGSAMIDKQIARKRQNDSNEHSVCTGGSSKDVQERERSHNRQGTGNNSGTHHARSNVEILSLFAPPDNRDVANELELLDMVDEDEQYEIVRSFAAKYIVPNLTGHGL